MFHPGIRQFSDARDATAKMLDESDAFRAAVAELIEATSVLRARLCLHGDFEDGVFYYNRYAAPELQAPMAGVDAALARVKGGAA